MKLDVWYDELWFNYPFSYVDQLPVRNNLETEGPLSSALDEDTDLAEWLQLAYWDLR